MPHSVCPWWIGYLLASPVRRLFDNPAAILDPYIWPGMTVLEPGPGMRFFTLELARQVGPGGRVVAVDIQPKMLAELRRRAERAGFAARIDTRLAVPDSMALSDLGGSVDFALVFAVVHEFPDQERFFVEVADALKAGGRLLRLTGRPRKGRRVQSGTANVGPGGTYNCGPAVDPAQSCGSATEIGKTTH